MDKETLQAIKNENNKEFEENLNLLSKIYELLGRIDNIQARGEISNE